MKTSYYDVFVRQLSNAPLPYVTGQPYLINRQHDLAKLIV